MSTGPMKGRAHKDGKHISRAGAGNKLELKFVQCGSHDSSHMYSLFKSGIN